MLVNELVGVKPIAVIEELSQPEHFVEHPNPLMVTAVVEELAQPEHFEHPPEACAVGRLVGWVVLLEVASLVNRGFCVWASIPSDCNRNWSYYDLGMDAAAVCLYGLLLGCATELYMPNRCDYFLQLRQLWVYALVVIVGLTMSLFNKLPISFPTVSDDGSSNGSSATGVLVLCTAGCGLLAALGWHIHRSHFQCSETEP